MSTGSNQDETLISKKRKRIVKGYIHPNKPEIKKFDFFNGDIAESGTFHMHNSKEFLATFEPVGADANQVGCWHMVKMVNPSQGSTSYQRIGMKYFLKYIKIKGHIAISPSIPFTIHYKLLLIKSDFTYNTRDDFFAMNYCNYEPLVNSYFPNIESFCRHNFYKTYKWATGQADRRTSVTVISSGTLTPVDYVAKPTKTSTLGANPAYSYTLPDFIRFGATEFGDVNQVCYLPLNVSVQVNDNVDVGTTNFWIMLVTDHGIGVDYPYYGSGTQYLYRASAGAVNTPARFNFFACCYFTDL